MYSLMFLGNIAPILSDASRIEKVLGQYVEATRTYNVRSLDQLFDKEYVEISPLGEVDDRAKTLSYYKTVGPVPESIKLEEMSIRFPAKGIAVAIFKQVATVKAQERTMELNFRSTVVLKRSGTEWRMYSAQFVGIRKKND